MKYRYGRSRYVCVCNLWVHPSTTHGWWTADLHFAFIFLKQERRVSFLLILISLFSARTNPSISRRVLTVRACWMAHFIWFLSGHRPTNRQRLDARNDRVVLFPYKENVHTRSQCLNVWKMKWRPSQCKKKSCEKWNEIQGGWVDLDQRLAFIPFPFFLFLFTCIPSPRLETWGFVCEWGWKWRIFYITNG